MNKQQIFFLFISGNVKFLLNFQSALVIHANKQGIKLEGCSLKT